MKSASQTSSRIRAIVLQYENAAYLFVSQVGFLGFSFLYHPRTTTVINQFSFIMHSLVLYCCPRLFEGG